MADDLTCISTKIVCACVHCLPRQPERKTKWRPSYTVETRVFHADQTLIGQANRYTRPAYQTIDLVQYFATNNTFYIYIYIGVSSSPSMY
jgi:hypothetical protein